MTGSSSSSGGGRVAASIPSRPPANRAAQPRLIAALADAGLVQRLFPPGGEARATELCLIRQGLARTSTHAETAFAMQGLGAYPILQSGTPEQTSRWIPEVAAGRAVPGFALTEPAAGSDAAHLALAAEADGPGFRLTGHKAYISNAPEADLYTVFARTGPDPGASGVTAFLVPGDSPGLSGSPIEMLGAHPLGALDFDGVPVDRSQVIGRTGRGFRVAMRTLDLFRPSVGAFAVGIAEAALADGGCSCHHPPGVRTAAGRIPGRLPSTGRHGSQDRCGALAGLSGRRRP